MELTQLTFAVDTTPLDTADKKIRGLGEALKTLERPMSAIAKDSSTVASGVEEVASKAQAAGSKLKGVEASLEKVSTAMKIFRGETVEVGDEVVNLGSSFTKSQANFLALQKQLGASADQLKSFAKEFNDFNKITSANTFDNSIAGVQRLTKDIRELSEVNKLAAANTTLTRDQVMNLVRDTERLQQAMQSMGKSNDEINASIAQQTQQYVNLANEKNKLIAQTKAMEDSARAAASAELERAKASAYVTKEAEKLAFVNAQLKEGFTVSSANALYKYKEALDLTGMSADQARTKLAAFGEQLKSKQSSSPFAALVKDAEETRKQVNHLARDVSVQLGDIAISLAGGQNPFMVMIQQGDQIRGALMRAKDSGVDSSNAIRNALGMMADSFVDVGKMAGTFFVGSIESAGNAVKRLVAEKTLLGAAIDTVNAKMIAQGGVSANLASYIQKLGTLFTYLTGTAIVGATLALTTFTVAQLAVIKESDNLVRSIHSQGAAFGVSSEEANKMITSLSSVGVSSSKAAQAMQAMIEGGKQSKESFALVAEAATLMSTYAGVSIDKTVKEFDKIADAPSKSLIELGKATGYVTLEMVQEVQQLEKVGATQEAVRRATEILAEAKKKAAGDIARDLSAVATAWIEIKTAIQAGFDAFKNSTVAEGTMKVLATVAKELAFAIYGIGTAARIVKTLLGSFPEIGKNLDAISADVKAFRASLDAAAPSVGGLTAEQKQFNDQQLAGAEATEKLNKAISGGAKDNVKSMTQGAYVAARMTEELQKAGQGAVYSAELQKTAVAKFKKEYEELTKVKSGPKGSKPKETFSIATDNTIAETKKSLDTQLKLVKEFENNRRDALKNAYESGLISRGEYLAQETAMTIDAFESQQQVIDKYQQYLDSFNQRRINVIKSYDDAVAKGGNKQELAKQLSNELANLDRAANGASETLDAMRASLSAATDKRFTESWKESNKALMESKKAYEEFESSVNNANQERQSEIQLQIQLSSAHGAEAEAIKASTAAMKSYAPAINKMALELRKAQQEYDNFMKSIDYSDDSKFEAQMLDADRLQKNLAQQRTNYNNAVAQARQDSEQAATDASTKYQIEKYNELKGTLSDSIYTAIFEGGKKGGDVLKNYLMKEFNNFAIKVLIEPIIGSVLSGIGASVGSSVASSATSSAAGSALGSLGGSLLGGVGAIKALGSNLAAGFTSTVSGWFSSGAAVTSMELGGMGTAFNAGAAIANTVPYVAAGTLALNALGVFRKTELKDTGIRGILGTESKIEGYKTYRKSGTLFSGPDWWDEKTEVDPKLVSSLQYQFDLIQSGMVIMSESLGLGADSVKNFSKSINVSFKDLDAEGISKKLTELYAEISNEMAAVVLRELVKESDPVKFNDLKFSETILGLQFNTVAQLEASIAVWNKSIETGFDAAGNKLSEGWIRELGDAVNQANDILDSQTEKLIESYQWFGETFSETLKRLSSSITTVNESFRDLGYTLMDVSLQGASKASDIISLFGGEDQYIQATGYFYENAYTQEEKAANLTNRLSEALGEVNEELPDSISGYRDLVDAYAKQGDAGREVWASLILLFPAFETLVKLNEEVAAATETVEQAYTRLTAVNRTAEDVANERISLEDRFFNAVATTAEMAEKARNAIDPMNRALYDAVLVAEATKAAVEAERKERVDGLKAEREAQAKLTEMSRQAVNTLSEGLAKLNAEATKTQRISAVTGLTAAEQAQNTALVDFIDAAYETQAKLTSAGADTTETAAIITKALSQLSKSVESARLLAGDFAGAMTMAMEDAKRTSAELSKAFTSESADSRRIILEESLKISREFSAYLSENALRVTDFTKAFGQAVGGAQGAAAQQAGMDYQEFADRFSDAVVAAVGPAVSGALSRSAAVRALPQNAQGVAAIRYVTEVQAQNTPSALAFQAQTELTALKGLESAMQKGAITAVEFADAVAVLRSTTKTAGDTIEDWSTNLQKFVDEYAATGGAGMETAEDIAARAWLLFDTAAGSAEFYFRQMGDAVKEFNAEASNADDSIDAITGFVGRMKSAAAVFGESAQAMLDSAAGNPYKNYQTGSGTEFDATLYNSKAVSSAADTLAGVITTRTAAAITNSISALPSFDTGSIDAFKGRYAELTKAINETSSTDPTKLVAGANALVDFIKSADLGDARIEGLLEANTDKWAGGVAGINQLVYDLDAVVNSISSTGASAKDVALLMQDLGEFDNAGLEKTFYRLSDALNTGKISAAQYSELIELSANIYLGTADAVTEAVLSIEEEIDKLRNKTKTNAEIAQEHISLQDRLFAATATTAQIAEKARNAIDAYNLELYDQVIAAEAAKALNQTKKEAEAEMLQADIRLAQARGNRFEADQLQQKAFIAGLGDMAEELKKVKIAAYEYSKSIDNQIEAFDLLKGINTQIEELQASSGPLDEIKTGIQAYITKLEELGQLTPEAQKAIDQLSDLQLGKGRKNLYDQLLSPEEKSERDASDLSASFAGLGVQMPTTTAAFRALIDATTDPTLKDSLLEMVPAFVSVQGAAAQATETIEQAYSRLKNVTRTNEDIAREKISLEERRDAATLTTTQIAEKARNAIDAYNLEMYDQVIAAESAKALLETQKQAAGEKLQADIRLAQAQNNITEVEKLQKQDFVAGLVDLTEAQKTAKIEAYDYAKAIDKQIAILQERTGLENSLHQLLGNTAILRERELAALDPSNRALQQRIWAIEDAKSATDKALAALERTTAEQIKQLEKSFTATDLAMQVLEKAIDKEKQRLQEQLDDAQESTDSIKRVFEVLEESVRSLRGEVDQASKMQVEEARATLSSALTSGIPSDTAALEDAISVLKADVEQGLYATSYDKSRAFLVLANDLENLKKNSEPQLTTAEQQVKLAEDQIKYLDDLLTKAKDQISGIRDIDASLFGIDKNIQDVEKAQSQLLSATQSEQEARNQIDKLNEQLIEFKTQVELLRGIDNSIIDVETAVDNVKTAINTEMQAMTSAVNALATALNKPATTSVTTTTTTSVTTTTTTGSTSASSLISTALAGGGAYEQINSDGSVTVYQAGGAITIPADAAKNLGYYADGGYYPGGLALVGEEGPELINFSNPGMVYTAAQSANLMKGDNSELAEELRALRQEVQMLRAEARATAVNTSKTARILDDVTQGGDSLKTTAA